MQNIRTDCMFAIKYQVSHEWWDIQRRMSVSLDVIIHCSSLKDIKKTLLCFLSCLLFKVAYALLFFRNDGMTYKAASHQTMYKTDPRSHPAQSYRAQSVDGNQKFDYV